MPKRLRLSLILRRSVTGGFWSFSSRFTTQARNRQGNDVGTSYRSAIFYTSDEQKRIAEDTIADVDASGLWPGKVVTEVVPAGDFWEAEPEHQDYLQRYPGGYTCHFVRPHWRLPSRTDKVAKEA
jgi:peptide-methionine (S)-S-oxide reductase